MLVLGLETSCDDTAVGIVEDGRNIISNIVFSQADMHSEFGGIIPEVASREHIVKIIPGINKALNEARMNLNDIDAVSVTYGPGLAGSLLIGVNNQFRGYNISQYREEFENLLIRSINFSKNINNVFVLSIPDYGVTPFGKNMNQEKIFREINIYNQINREISEKYDVMYFNITDISRMAESDSTLLANDKLHPSGKMYKMWVERIKNQIMDSLILNY